MYKMKRNAEVSNLSSDNKNVNKNQSNGSNVQKAYSNNGMNSQDRRHQRKKIAIESDSSRNEKSIQLEKQSMKVWVDRLNKKSLLKSKLMQVSKPTVSIAFPSSIVKNIQTMELRSYLIGQIGRICAIVSLKFIKLSILSFLYF